MEKEIGKLPKNDTTEIVIRVDDFGGKRGLTIREFVTTERYTGFTKAGVRISPENFSKFKEMINSISEQEMQEQPEQPSDSGQSGQGESSSEQKQEASKDQSELPDY